MCGIVGIVSASPVDRQLIAHMRDSMVHRGPDHAGLWSSSDARVCLGHRRLAIVDLTPEANQPFISADGRFVITYNGEIYNFDSLRQELEGRGVLFRTRSDTEVLLEAYRCWREGCLGRLSGMFAFAIWDTVQRRLFCARDRVGEKPFYYAFINGDFIFASELKAILRWPRFRRKVHYPALVDYLSFGFVPDPKSIWEHCWKLPPGHWMSVDTKGEGRVIVKDPVAFWDMHFEPDHSVNDWEAKILETLQYAAKEMSFADVPVGAFLSGGVDSSSVIAALSKAGCMVNTFTIGFDEQDYDERPWAREVSRLYNAAHVERVVSAQDIARVMEKLVWHYDEPFNDYSYLPTFYLCREARKFVTVALSGDGGDELFAGYTKYRRLALRQDWESLVPSPLSRLAASAAGTVLPRKSFLFTRILPYQKDLPSMLTDMLTTVFPFQMLCGVARGPLRQALKHYAPEETVRSLLEKAPPHEVRLVNAMRYLDVKLTLAGDILVKLDRASMAVSLEARPVYLNREMLALAERIPSSLLANRNHAKKLLKGALKPWLPDSVLYRKKMGFALPLKNWIDGELCERLACQDHSPLDDLLDCGLLNEMVRTHSVEGTDMTARIHSLLFLRNWSAKWS
jgi:asparagine synthase (glutamine-hydrolysing)